MKRILLFTVLLSCFASIISAQITISGTVIDSETGAPIIGANIRVNHSLNGCTTNAKGEFILRDLPNSKQAISITHVSYAPQAYTTDKSEKNVIIRMIENHVNIGQVVVTGTGTHHRMTDSPVPVTVITAKDFHDANIIIIIGIAGAAHQSWSANIYSVVGDMFPKSTIATIVGIGKGCSRNALLRHR